jgi:hypothetical protein
MTVLRSLSAVRILGVPPDPGERLLPALGEFVMEHVVEILSDGAE